MWWNIIQNFLYIHTWISIPKENCWKLYNHFHLKLSHFAWYMRITSSKMDSGQLFLYLSNHMQIIYSFLSSYTNQVVIEYLHVSLVLHKFISNISSHPFTCPKYQTTFSFDIPFLLGLVVITTSSSMKNTTQLGSHLHLGNYLYSHMSRRLLLHVWIYPLAMLDCHLDDAQVLI